MNKFHYALIVLAFGFISVAGVSNLYTPLVAFATGSQQVASHDSNDSSHESDNHDSSNGDHDSNSSDDNRGSNHENDSHESDSNESDNHGSSGDNDSHENDGHESSQGDDNHGSVGDNHDDDSNGHDGDDDHSGDNHDGDDNENDGDDHETPTPTPTTATIVATKIICDNESDLPNWGAGAADITSNTAATFLSSHSNCHTANWTFEWAPNGTANPGDQTAVAGGVWTAFSGSTTVPAGSLIWVREQFNNDYIPFAGVTTTPSVSAEIYCNTDILNYDNYDWVNPVVAGQTYNCVAFNVQKTVTNENTAPIANAGVDQIITLPTNSVTLDASASTDSDGSISSYVWDFVSGPSTINPTDTVTSNVTGLVEGTYVFKLTVTDNDGATGTDTVSITVNHATEGLPACSDNLDNDEDNLVDTLDPGCHTDGNAGNPNTYNPGDDAETDVPACSNTGDDDNDGVADALDPGCHTDGNVNNTGSYDPNDNDETNATTPAQCSDGVDNSDTEDTLVDSADPGCHTDGNASNSASYNPDDNDETDAVVVVDLPQCSDGIDNDKDGKIDFPADKGCKNAEDNNEKNSSGSTGGGSTRPIGQVLSATNTCGIYVDKYLRVGHANNIETVKKVQTFMNDYMNAGLVVDGIYGTKTETAVRNFQVAHADKVLAPWNIDHQSTGIFYLTTQTEVNNIMCPTLNLPIPANLINFSQNPGTPAPVVQTAVIPYTFPAGTNI